MHSKTNKLWLAFFAATVLSLTACSNHNVSQGTTAASTKTIVSAVSNNPPAPVQSSNSNVNSSIPPLSFEVHGTGNHDQFICVPAQSKLQLRMKPHANTGTLMPPAAHPNYPDGSPVYDGTPAYYNSMRVRMQINGSVAAWDYTANNEAFSVVGDYTAYMNTTQYPITPSQNCLAQADPLPVPEYKDVYIFGSNYNDGQCTYWEKTLGKCSCLSEQYRQADQGTCNSGEVKVTITKIVSDYPCSYDRLGWCKGGSVQIIPDLQHWSITVQAFTENTRVY